MTSHQSMYSIVNISFFQYPIIVVACILSYGSSLHGDFVFDDSVAIVRNTDVTSANISVSTIFAHDFWGANLTDLASHKSYRPLVTLMFRWEVQTFGLVATYMKTTNLLLHCIASCLVLTVLRRMIPSVDGMPAFLAAALFSVHPVHTEAVSGVVGRADLLCAVCYLLVLLIYDRMIRSQRSPVQSISNWIFVCGLASVALLCKETGVTVLPMCVVIEMLGIMECGCRKDLRKSIGQIFKRRDLIVRWTVLAGVTMLFIVLRLWIMNFEKPSFKPMDNPIAASDELLTRVLSQSYLYWINVWLFLCPMWLCFDWTFHSIAVITYLWDYRLVFVGLLYYSLWMLIRRGSRSVHQALAMIIVPFLPASGILRVGFVIAERILYVPSIGFCMLVALGFDRIVQWIKTATGRPKSMGKFHVVHLVFGALLLVMCFRCRWRSHEWTSEELLFRSGLVVCPENAKIYYNIAKILSDRQQNDLAIVFYKKAIDLHEMYESALMNLGNIYREKNQLETAELYLKTAIRALEEFPAAWMNLGIVEAALGKRTEAMISYRRALKYRPRYAHCYYNMGILHMDQHEPKQALRCWRETISISPRHAKAWANILAYLDNDGRTTEVLNVSAQALSLLPNDPAIMFTRANAFGKLGEFEEAERLYRSIISLRPTNALYHVNLGVLYHRWNRPAKAIGAYEQALLLDPRHHSARQNVLKLRRQMDGSVGNVLPHDSGR